ncbi:hypothetical protein PN419_00405 [Halorubrum ezzemoulense]|uniref:hypothetical protein n=1 Tax=Halorubrum ezzemoulense TaxID=337243 RepID=UPI00232A9A72|nr:hypothetical protein [Halorubrum ezzemoulense]MDB9247468.1 hypothetical protein [Halorubrum ezzemoulense]MDB9258623.1 hypothetical protein [Halorubrum ezzemoulense]MDB9264519.1 hypothetical protein [Halorubrum ezzemoulense]MDB9268984.1 hypothetical protein [Halorubrum ezzemoulense]MDB9271487.1 hypothetical protein [Halorubrum ezzemoulense]
MCRNCETDDELDECAFDADEHHPDDWPDDATRADYPDELPEPTGWHDDSGKPYDSNWRRYNPYQGSKTPTDGRCNALLSGWRDRYGEPRYCMRLPEDEYIDDGSQFCRVHNERGTLMDRAADLFTHGIYSKTIRHIFDKLDPWQKLVVLAFYDSYVQESHFEFDAELQEHTIDFSGYDRELPLEVAAELDEDEQYTVGVPIPNEHEIRCFALYRAALKDMSASLAERETLPDADTAAMERETTVTVTDDGREITDLDEHHLNVAISRTDNDREDLLRFGGVPMDSDADVEINAETPEELVLDVDDTAPAATEDASNPVEDELMTLDEGDLDEVDGDAVDEGE